jgi:hypothetical protein
MQAAAPELLRQLARTGAVAALWLAAALYFDDTSQPRAVHGALVRRVLRSE